MVGAGKTLVLILHPISIWATHFASCTWHPHSSWVEMELKTKKESFVRISFFVLLRWWNVYTIQGKYGIYLMWWFRFRTYCIQMDMKIWVNWILRIAMWKNSTNKHVTKNGLNRNPNVECKMLKFRHVCFICLYHHIPSRKCVFVRTYTGPKWMLFAIGKTELSFASK